MGRHTTLRHLRVMLAALVMTATSVAVQGTPVPVPAPVREALQTPTALASFCASNPSFAGRLTGSSSTTTAAGRVKNGTLYGYISNVASTWSCTAFLRYSAITWNTTGSTGTFDWGNLINSTSVACNYMVGSTDFIKSNSTTDCADSDAEYALPATLTEGIYQNDAGHDNTGDFSFAHADCGSYYNGEVIKTGQTFSTSDTGNRPGANCDPITLDSTNTGQVVTYDKTAPSLNVDAPSALAGTSSTSYTVQFDATDAVSGFGGTATWKLQRQIATNTGASTCGTFTNDTAAGNYNTGVASASNQTKAQTLVLGSCYRWTLAATDQNGNTAATNTSANIITDNTAPAVAFVTPVIDASQNTTTYSVSWSETEAGSGVNTRSLQRQRVAISSGTCPTSGWANDGSAATGASPVSATLTSGFCYRWQQTVVDKASNSSGAVTSAVVLLDATVPMANFTTPDEGTTTIQSATGYTTAWSESYGTGATFTSRSNQRQKGPILTPNTCADVVWADSGTPGTSGSAVITNGLSSNYCYRWKMTLTNSLGKSGTTVSGSVLVDPTAPTGTIVYPAANQSIAGDVVVTGTATDVGSFSDYVLEYGSGTSPASWTTIVTGATRVISTGPLATWATASMTGVYTLRLTVHDTAGNAMTPVTRLVYVDNTARGDESYYSRVPFDLGGGWGIDMGVATGEARLSRDVFSIPSYGPSQAMSLSYSSAETAATGKVGVGWSSNLTQYLTFESGFVVWHRADGGRVPFGNVGGTWTPLAGHYETLTRNASDDTVTLKDQTKLVFENTGAGRLKRIENRFGKALTFSWGTASATATDASGRVTTLAIDSGNSRITSVTDSAGRAWTFGYTGTGASSDLTTFTEPDPDGAGSLAAPTTTLAYDGSHRLTGVTRSRSRVSGSPETIAWTVGYTSGKATSVTDPIDAIAATPARNKFTYTGATTKVELLKEYGASPVWNTWTYTLDALGRVTAATDPEGFTTSTTYDANGNLTRLGRPIDGSAFALTAYTYDATKGNLLTETVQIDATGDVDAVTGNVVRTAYSYNSTNDVLTRSEADNDAAVKLVTKYTYDGSGHLTSTNVNCTTSGTTPPSTASTCTGAGTQDASTNLITSYAYTANHQLEFEQDPMGRVTKHVYDADGNETSVIRNCTSSGTTAPSPFSSCTAAGTADHQTNVTTSSAYSTSSVGGKAGSPTSTTDPVGNVTTTAYDNLGRLTTEVLPGETGVGASIPATTNTTTYDDLDNTLIEAESWTPVGGGSLVTRTTTHVYDTVNRETSITDGAGTTTDTTHDAAGNAVEVDAGGSVTQSAFDGLGRLVSESHDSGSTTNVYDAAGNAVEAGSAEGTITAQTFNYVGNSLTETIDPDGTPLTAAYAYDILGRQTQATEADVPPAVGPATTRTYDRAGRELTTTTSSGTVTNVYDRNGNVVASKQLDGSVTATTYDPLDRATDVVGNCTNAGTTQPAAGAPCAATGTVDATTNLRTTTYYDGAGAALAVKDTKGVTARTIPNVRGLAKTAITNCTDSGTTPTSNSRACVGAGTADATTNVKTTTTYDGTGAEVGSTVAVGTGAAATTETAYDPAGQVLTVKDPRGTITRNFYNGDGQLTKTVVNCTSSGTTVPASGWESCTGAGTQDGTYNVTTTYGYDADGNQTKVTAPNSRVTRTAYDADGRTCRVIQNSTTSDGTWDGYVDQCSVAIASSGNQDLSTFTFYDAAGRQAAVVTPTLDGSTRIVTRSVFDTAGRVIQTIANCTNTGTTFDITQESAADCAGTGTTTDSETNIVTNYTYDDAGNLTKVVAPDASAAAGSTAAVTTRYAYDAANRLCRVLEASTITDGAWTTAGCAGTISGTATTNLSTRYTYDPAGNLASAIDARAKTTSYGYDAAGRMTSTIDADGGTLVYGYNALGQRIRQENRSDPPTTASVTWTYDGAGRTLTRTANSATTTYTYDANGNQLTASDGTFTITSAYDRLNRVLTVDDEDAGTTADTTYTYSLTGPSWTDPTGTYLVTLDAFDRATALNEPVSTTASFTWAYRADGQLASQNDPNGSTTTFGYDALGRAKTKETKTGATSRAAYTWARNRAGQVLSENTNITGDPTNNTRSFGYDALARLTSFTDGATTTSYGWAETLNRTSVQVGAGAPIATTYDNANRPLNQAGVSNAFTSDADGRLTARPDAAGAGYQRFEWDSLGRLTKVKAPTGGSVIATYTYDPLDRLRMVDYGSNNRTRFRYQGLTTAAVQTINDQTSAVIRNIGTSWGGELLEDWTGTNSNWRLYGTNGHHDVTWTASSTGTVSGTVRYDPWGTGISTTGSVPDFRFQSSWADDTTKLSWVITRWYASAQGRFMSEDTLLGEPRQPDSRHLYAYGEGEPVGRADPTGRYWEHTASYEGNIPDNSWTFAMLGGGVVCGALGLAFVITGLVCSGALALAEVVRLATSDPNIQVQQWLRLNVAREVNSTGRAVRYTWKYFTNIVDYPNSRRRERDVFTQAKVKIFRYTAVAYLTNGKPATGPNGTLANLAFFTSYWKKCYQAGAKIDGSSCRYATSRKAYYYNNKWALTKTEKSSDWPLYSYCVPNGAWLHRCNPAIKK